MMRYAPALQNTFHIKTWLLTSAAGVMLAACGGGSGSAPTSVSPPPPPPNNAPTAKAGDDKSLDITTSAINLDGSGSTDPDGDRLTYRWSIDSQPAGMSVAINNSTAQVADFTASAPGDYSFTLTVSDPSGASSSDSVTFTLINQAPSLVLSNYKTEGFVGSVIELDATGSTDQNGQNLTYSWLVTDAPSDSGLNGKTYSDGVPNIAFDAVGSYTLELTISDGYEHVTSTLNVITVEDFEIIALSSGFSDAEYDTVNDRIVTVKDAVVTIIDTDGTETDLALPLEATAVSVAPNGNFAAVGHDAFVSYVDLNAETIVTHAVPEVVGDLVLDDEGFAHIFPDTGQHVRVQSMNMQTGAVTASDGGTIRHKSKARLHASGTKIYSADTDVSPQDVERLSIANGQVTRDYDSPYHGDYPFCGNLWMGPSGDSFITKCGIIVNATDDQSTDMTFKARSENISATSLDRITHASSSDFSRLYYAIVTPNVVATQRQGSDIIKLIDADSGNEVEEIELPAVTPGAIGNWYAKYVFARNTSNERQILAVDDIDNPQKFALIKQYETAAKAANFAPKLVTDKYISTKVSNLVTLDASASFDLNGKDLTYEWMLIEEPAGSAIVPTGLESAQPQFTPSVAGVYKFSVRVSNGERQSEIKEVSVSVFENNESLVKRIEGSVTDAEYSDELNALVYLTDDDTRLKILSLSDLSLKTVELGQTVYQVGIGPNGDFAAVSFGGSAGLVDLNAAVMVDTQTYSADWGDIVLDGNNRAHIASKGRGGGLYSLDFSTDKASKSTGYIGASSLRLRMHPNESWIYGATTSQSPSDIEKWDISTFPVNGLGDSSYHGDYSFGGNIWVSEDGLRLLAASGLFFASSDDPDADMIYAGGLSDNAQVGWADHSSEANEWAVVNFDEKVSIYSDDFYVLQRQFDVADLLTENGPQQAEAQKVFHSKEGDKIFVLSKVDGLSDGFAVQIEE